jgi:pimeloyl-ACP methyl ester carboxylesterase
VSRTIVFIHGAWVTPRCWAPFVSWFAARGYQCMAPGWPGKQRPIDEIRADPSPLAGLGIGEIVDHYAEIIRALKDPPILIGHSFGGLFAQILLDRGLGTAAVAIDPAPPRGVIAYELSAYRSLGGVLLTPGGWHKVVRWSYRSFRYGFVHTLPEADARAVYDDEVVPESGRIFYQAAFTALDRHSPATVHFGNANRGPLLLIAGAADHIVPAGIVRRTARRYAKAGVPADLREFPGRTHWIIAEPGWQEVAGAVEAWLVDHGQGPGEA